MGARGLIFRTATAGILVAACGGGGSGTGGTLPTQGSAALGLPERVVADFEKAVLTSKDAYVALFDFVAVGEYEILLHRYDLNGRLNHLTDAEKKQFFAEDGTPYPEARERRNVGNFYPRLAQRTVGTGGCKAGAPRTRYGKELATFEPLPATSEVEIEGENKTAPTPAGYQTLYTRVTEYTKKGGVVGFTCSGGQGGLALVYTARPNQRGYDLITIYDD
jgi:hypothetical protein